ncbi:SCO6880 family protein [Kineosporia sp. NBRC 101731]|uniref:SCO6880 family protein n=1 Tax=Kineosporia sp. NBRC 101731 TaxID=3032199 RepID=UPI0024A5C70C|nr:SCO6880 family protein [Kineosporia sp. NBRC 101731]GLY33408.1 hypothetical protein Kisp02_67730 [Kineosporia sp. NBRC 101731]
MSSQTVTGEPVKYRTYLGWQPEKVAFMFGLSGQRVALIVAAVLAGIWPLAASRIALAPIAWPIALILAGLAFLRIAGRTVDEWVSAFTSYHLLRLRNQHRFVSAAFTPLARTADEPATNDDAPDVETDATDSTNDDGDSNAPEGAGGESESGWRRFVTRRPAPMDLPGILAPLTILDATMGATAAGAMQAGDDALAVAYHRIDRTYTAVARVTYPGIGLVDSERREARVNGWGALLSGLCTEGQLIVRVQALQRMSPASGAALRRWHTDHLGVGAPDLAREITTGLLATAGVTTSQREAFLAFTMDSRRAASAIKAAGGGTAGAVKVLTRQLRALSSSVAGADVQIESWLGPRDLAEVIRTAYDPHAARSLAERRAITHTSGTGTVNGGVLAAGVAPAVAGPSAAEALPGSYRHDGGYSATFWVHDWPRSQVFSTALAPLLGESTHRRAFSLHIEPLGPRSAEREVMRERTARSVAVRMRQRTGQIVPEHEQAALDRARAQDMDRAAGHGLVRFTGYVTVTVTEERLLEDACAELEADAAAARIELRRMWYAQDVGFSMSALPLGFGLPRKRW